MALITARKFTANLTGLKKHVTVLRDTMVESIAFARFHAIRHGNKKPISQLELAAKALPRWAEDIVRDGCTGCTQINEQYNAEDAHNDALKTVMFGFMDKAEADAKRKEADAKRKAAKAEADRKAAEALAELEKMKADQAADQSKPEKTATTPPVVIAPAKGPSIGQGNGKPKAGKKGTATPSVVTSPDETFCLKHGDEVLELSQGEYDALVEQLMKMRRAPAKKVS